LNEKLWRWLWLWLFSGALCRISRTESPTHRMAANAKAKAKVKNVVRVRRVPHFFTIFAAIYSKRGLFLLDVLIF